MDRSPLIVTVAPNGASRTKADHSALPMFARELAAAAGRCLDAGAAMLHLHVRAADGSHTLDPGVYRDAIAIIRRAVGRHLVIQVTSESGKVYRPGEQMRAIREVRPEAVSLALRELIPEQADERPAGECFQWLADNHCVAQYILYTEAEVDWYRALRRRGVIPDTPHWVLFVLGRHTSGQRPHPLDLVPFLREPLGVPWSVCAFGRTEHVCAVTAAGLGGHVRVGFENNLCLKDGSTAADNADLVRQICEAAQVLNRPLIDADGLRELFATGA